jgi:outer membrane lipoprotein LolB
MDSHCLRTSWTTSMSIARGIAAAAAAILFVAGCATRNLPPASSPPLAARPLAPAFSAAGRVAARVTGESTRGFSGGFSWVHRQAEDTVELLTPLGQIAARLRMTREFATIESADGRVTQTTDPEQFISNAFGVPLPLAALPNWFQGVPLARIAYRAETDSLGRPTTIWQNGWQIQYSEYVDETVGARPSRLQLNQGDVEARIIISEWSAP